MHTLRSPRAAAGALLLLAGALAACDIPTKAPILQQTWVVPADSVSVDVAQLLPAAITVNGAGTAFVVSVPAPGAFAATLGTLCPDAACQVPGTVVANVPAFTSGAGALTRTVTFPATVASATVTGGTLALSVNNQLGFDPLRPNGALAAPYGSIAITITNGAASATTTLLGSPTLGIPNGVTTDLSVPVPAGVYAGSFTVSVVLDVPAGGPATLSASNAITVTPSVAGLTVSQAAVVVNNEAISTTPTAFDLADLDFADQVEGGGVLLDVTNPFTASAALTVEIFAPPQGGGPSVTVTKPLAIPATPTSSATVTLTKAELQSLVGKSGVTVSVSGAANGTGAGNTVAVTPGQRMMLRTNVQLILNVGA